LFLCSPKANGIFGRERWDDGTIPRIFDCRQLGVGVFHEFPIDVVSSNSRYMTPNGIGNGIPLVKETTRKIIITAIRGIAWGIINVYDF
jgi:hypothetical protein